MQKRTIKMIKDLEGNSYEELFQKLDLFSLSKRRVIGDMISLIAVFQCLKSCCSEEGMNLFCLMPKCRTKANGVFPRTIGTPSVEIFKLKLDNHLPWII